MQQSHSQRLNNSKWIQPPPSSNISVPFIKAQILRPVGNDKILYQAQTQRGDIKLEIQNTSSYDISNGLCFDDMCQMDILNQPEVLYNLVQRYKNDEIFTFIGPTLIIINPYKILPQYFSNQALMRIRQKIVSGNTQGQKPHVYLMAGKAYTSMIDQQKNQAIVISGQSGAGKTQSTKYCLQLLTTLSHKEKHQIQGKILACNPILEAFGNSKTTRNDNSSRFGKYMRVFFREDNTISGAAIDSYLLQKSRVVSASQGERSYHIFYALIAAGLEQLSQPQNYKYLKKTNCYTAVGIDDKKFFHEIANGMTEIGFCKQQQNKIWSLLAVILELGNIQFDETQHVQNQSKPCTIINKQPMKKAAKKLQIKQQAIEKLLLYEKKPILKDIHYSAYNKQGCHANINTLSKAIYQAIFEFLLYKINISLKPKIKKNYISISILDIFGFENFNTNNFQQLCINFTNQKLLKLYNQYVFQRQMSLLRQDGLGDQIDTINPPANDDIIEIMSGKISLFSIINDNTIPKQYNDTHIIQGIQNKFGKNPILKFDPHKKMSFMIKHSQCAVNYTAEGFKQKNQDKILDDIANIVNNLFQHQNNNQQGNTLLKRFSRQINLLMNQLSSSSVHFIRCIKPNQKKQADFTDQRYILTQIRYLGVFQTIQIRKKTFPSRFTYREFLERFEMLFPALVGNNQAKTKKILEILNKRSQGYLLGRQRVYMDSQIEHKLSVKLHEYMYKKVQAGKKIWKFYKQYKFKKYIFKKLSLLVKRKRIWQKFATEKYKDISLSAFNQIKKYSEAKKLQEKQKKNQKLNQLKKQRQKQQTTRFQNLKKQRNQKVPKMVQIINKLILYKIYTKLKQYQIPKPKVIPPSNNDNKFVPKPLPKKPNLQNIMDESFVQETDRVYKRKVVEKKQQKQFEFNQSFINDRTMDISQRIQILYQGYLPVQFYDKKKHSKSMDKLRTIFAQTYKFQIGESEEDFFSPPSSDSKFVIQDVSQELLNKILGFNSKDFFKNVLRKRTNFIGMSKDEDDILVVKSKPLSKSLTLLTTQDEPAALKAFKVLLKIGQQSKLDNVFKLIEDMINMCQNTSPQVKDQIFLQLIKQANSDNQLSSVRIIQTMAVFLHIYSPDNDFLMAGLNFYFKRLSSNNYTEKQTQYVNYIYKKIIRKMQYSTSINYMPIKYQMMALMCKRQISVPVYLSVGNSILIRVQSYETFNDIKLRVLEEFGIDHQRLRPQYFTFFEIMNFQNQQLEESPINQKNIVWDTITYWERAKQRYKEKQFNPPAFFLMLKIRYTYQCHYEDQQSVELMFHQCYFDYFIGRIRMDIYNMGVLSACIKLLKFRDNPENDTTGTYPIWAIKKYQQKILCQKMMENCKAIQLQGLDQYDIKYRFLTICEQCPLSLSLVIQTEQNIKLFFKPKRIYLTEKNEIIEQIPIKKITKFAQDDEKFVFQIRGTTQTKIIYTEHGSICCNYLSLLPKLISHKK